VALNLCQMMLCEPFTKKPGRMQKIDPQYPELTSP
jgi:hypothetical protein